MKMTKAAKKVGKVMGEYKSAHCTLAKAAK
jgi:hypothetical protein